jgi:hypothetical protein
MMASQSLLKTLIASLFLVDATSSACAQISQLQDTVKKEELHFFCEGYFAWSTTEVRNKQEDFYYNHPTLNSPGINFTSIQYHLEKKRWGLDVGIQDGRYVQANYATQPLINRLISQAQVHYHPFKKQDLSFQVGIFPSHIGFESAWNSDNLTLTRSLLAENSPYYESGFSAAWNSHNQKWGIKALCLSGWQQSQWKWPVQHPSFGWATYCNPHSNWKLAYNGFYGNLDNQNSQTYTYHNFYMQGKWKNYECIMGYDIGIKDNQNQWSSPVVIIARSWNQKFKTSIRWEKMKDPDLVILKNADESWTARNACSVNLDWKFNSHFTSRLEYKFAWPENTGNRTKRDLISVNIIYQCRWERLTLK